MGCEVNPRQRATGEASVDWKVGDVAEIRSLDEIAATLDSRGTVGGMPFMPEMAAFAGRRFRVVKVAHKTCDASGFSYARALDDAVHLETRCDGSVHGDCHAACRFFWKTDWLKKVAADAPAPAEPPAVAEHPLVTRLRHGASLGEGADKVYFCQATEIKHATTPLYPWMPRQFGRDLSSGNIPLGELVRYFAVAVVRFTGARVRRLAQRLTRPFRPAPAPRRSVECPPLDLKPGEWVRIKSEEEIVATLNDDKKNFGLSFDIDMVQFCGTTHRVLARIDRIIDEGTGRMIEFKRPCVALGGVICTGRHYSTRLFCPRGSYTFWREGWLERVDPPRGATAPAADSLREPA